ncbi:serine/threonine protein kinase [Nonomuraea sp. NN258]|uniref:serine/threonine protein kinase n=1 Tax=Nonomuraea antri TaxID=2730852 RepID=UPI00156906E8|nr:serine/threonine-protein kinase [Nonomuraea antri]NRQ38820.1 serine/threonine protein kinase [Nonomuraea antri]
MQLNDRSLIGQEVAGYYIEDIVGKGGMAVVYLALDPRLSRRVALKILNPVLSVDDRFRQRFILESRTVASIEHPNIIPIYEANADADGVLYIAMRYVDGLDLRRLIYDRGPLPLALASQIFAQTAAALDAAHAHDLIHRDVKPANILLAGDHVYLTDFGITKHRSSISGLTQTDQFIGTPRYMSPEQINKEHIDGRCDQYALACVVYEALSGRLPFQRENDIALLWAHLAEQPVPLSQMRPELPPAVDHVMGRALAKSPEQRYASCGEFAGALRDAMGGLHPGAYPGGFPGGAYSGPPSWPNAGPNAGPNTGPGAGPNAGSGAGPNADASSGPPSGPSPGVPSGPSSGPHSLPYGTPHLPPGGGEHALAGTGAQAQAVRGRPGRLPIVAATLVAAVAALALVAMIILNHRGDTWIRYQASSAAPLTFEYPGDWTARTHQDLFALASPHAEEFESLFVAGPDADWAPIAALIADDRESVSGLYVQVSEAIDVNAPSESMKAKMDVFLPGEVTLSKPAQDKAGTSPATRYDGSLVDPESGTRLGFVGYVIDRQPKRVLLMYFCAQTTCDGPAHDRIRDSVRLS